MLNYQKTGMEFLGPLLSNPVLSYWIDLWIATALEMHYAPFKAFVNASNLDFSVWPNQKIVTDLYNSNLCKPKQLY